MLRDHRGMRLTRRMKAVFWWCYTHSPHPQPAATILVTHAPPTKPSKMPGIKPVKPTKPPAPSRLGDAICWNELHHTTPYHNTWD